MARPGPFAGPGKSFPIGDKKHARLAIGGATRSMRAGNISPSMAADIKTKARAKLGIPAHHFGHRRPVTD